MPAPLAKGIIITVSVLVAAGLAAYENPQIREWIDRSRQKIAMALHSLGDDIQPRSRSPPPVDASMREEMSEMAEARRRQARAEIMERGRMMEERRKRKRDSRDKANSQGSGTPSLNSESSNRGATDEATSAWASAVQPNDNSESVLHRPTESTPFRESFDSPVAFRQLQDRPSTDTMDESPFESRYETEMRQSWNMPVSYSSPAPASTHASDSLLDLTPTSETVPDPDFSVPPSQHDRPAERSEYFSAAASTSSHTMSDAEPEYYYAHPEHPFNPAPVRAPHPMSSQIDIPVSSAPSVADSVDLVHASEVEDSEDGVLSEMGDGIRTPGSAWTDVGSVISEQ